MAGYINVTLNHFMAIQRWAVETGGSVNVDMQDLTMEVKHRGRYYRMYPTFSGQAQGRQVHLSSLTPDVRGFGGWRPYTTLTHPCSSDKQVFKAHLKECGLRTPLAWDPITEPPPIDYVVKARKGSFGREISGPYRAGTPLRAPEGAGGEPDALFAEQFVPGHMLKVWFWGRRAFFAHMDPFPAVTGDGRSTVEQLLRAKLAAIHVRWDDFEDLRTVRACLAFQGLSLESTLASGQEAWIEFRYGTRRYPATVGHTQASDNVLPALLDRAGSQLDDMGRVLADLMRRTIPVPVLLTADGMLDADNRIWWLEMNTNSLLPPEAYAAMFSDLFS